MMLDVSDQLTGYEAAFDRLQTIVARSDAQWLSSRRQEAMEQFLLQGWPTLDHEEWRFTSVRPIAETPFALDEPGEPVLAEVAVPHRMGPAAAVELVFLNGFYRPELSRVPALPGVTVMDLPQALRHHADLLEAHLARHADPRDDAFTALNTAFLRDGAFIHIAANAALPEPIHLLMLSSIGVRPGVNHPRHLIVADAGSRATVVENYVAIGGGNEAPYWSNAVTEVVLGPGADLQHYLLEQDAPNAFNIETLHVRQAAGSRFASHTALFGGQLVRNNVHVELAGDDCESLVNGLFVGRDRQHMDNHMRVVHGGLRGASRQFYKGILDEQAHGVFTGRIVVRPGAQQTDAKQTSRNLLLSTDAQIDTRPQLEIYADDVKCTHGATTGRLDEAAAFYLQARGISPEAARGLLIYAFAHESLDRMTLAPVRARLERLLLGSLPQAELLQHVIDLPATDGQPVP